jgi:HEAT repeat protein
MGSFSVQKPRFILLALGMLLLIAAGFVTFGPPHPVLAGKPAPYWFSQLDQPPARRDPSTATVLAAAPDTALPELRTRLAARDGPIRRMRLTLSARFPNLLSPMISRDVGRQAAAELLSEFGPRAAEATEALLAGLRVARHPSAVAAVQSALARLPEPPLDGLLAMVREKPSPVRLRGLQTLAEIGRSRTWTKLQATNVALAATDALSDADSDIVVAASACIQSTSLAGAMAIPQLLANLHRPDITIRGATIESLGILAVDPDHCVPALAGALNDGDVNNRIAAAQALGKYSTHATAAVEALVIAAADPRTRVAVVAVNSLGRVGPGAAHVASAMVANLKRPEAILRAATASALGRMIADEEPVILALGAALEDDDAYVRQNAARALGLVGPDSARVVAPLIDSLRDPVEAVRLEATVALGRIGHRAAVAIPHLEAARNDNPSVMTRPVLAALENIRDTARLAPGLPAR